MRDVTHLYVYAVTKFGETQNVPTDKKERPNEQGLDACIHTLQHAAARCNTLQHTATHYIYTYIVSVLFLQQDSFVCVTWLI